MKKIFVSLYILTCACVSIWAQAPQQPDLQTVDNRFFDPTRKSLKDTGDYHFRVDYRFEIGYAQNNQRSANLTYPDMFLHGGRVGATFDFVLPIHFSLQTGLLVDIAYGINTQHWRSLDAPSAQIEYLRHRVLEANITIPVRCYYTIPLWKKLNMVFFTGPQLSIGLTQMDFVEKHLSSQAQTWIEAQGYHTDKYDRLAVKELHRINIQWSLGGGLEWDRFRLQAGYQFGLNNLVRNKVISSQQMWEWGWFVTFCYRF